MSGRLPRPCWNSIPRSPLPCRWGKIQKLNAFPGYLLADLKASAASGSTLNSVQRHRLQMRVDDTDLAVGQAPAARRARPASLSGMTGRGRGRRGRSASWPPRQASHPAPRRRASISLGISSGQTQTVEVSGDEPDRKTSASVDQPVFDGILQVVVQVRSAHAPEPDDFGWQRCIH